MPIVLVQEVVAPRRASVPRRCVTHASVVRRVDYRRVLHADAARARVAAVLVATVVGAVARVHGGRRRGYHGRTAGWL